MKQEKHWLRSTVKCGDAWAWHTICAVTWMTPLW